MATKKKATGPERVDSRSYNGARRATVLQRWTSPTPDRFFGADFALLEFDHHPGAVWSSMQWLKRPGKADLYERWRLAPLDAARALVAEATTEDILRTLARIGGGQRIHHDGAARWTGLVRHLPLDVGTDTLVTLLERLLADPAADTFHAPAVLDGSEYNKTDFRYGPNVRGGDVRITLQSGLTRYWRYALGASGDTVARALPPALRDRTVALFVGQHEDGREHLHAPLTAPGLDEASRGLSREYNARVGLDDTYPMVTGTGN